MEVCETHDEVGGCSQCVVEDYKEKEKLKKEFWTNPKTGTRMTGYMVGYCAYCRCPQPEMRFVEDEGWVCLKCFPMAIDVMLANKKIHENNNK
jgi:hypothetical protein